MQVQGALLDCYQLSTAAQLFGKNTSDYSEEYRRDALAFAQQFGDLFIYNHQKMMKGVEKLQRN